MAAENLLGAVRMRTSELVASVHLEANRGRSREAGRAAGTSGVKSRNEQLTRHDNQLAAHPDPSGP